MCGWTEQKYLYVPGLSKVKEKLSPVSSGGDLNSPFGSAASTVCGSSSRLVQVTLPPTGTVSVAGENRKSSIVTALPSAARAGVIRTSATAAASGNARRV